MAFSLNNTHEKRWSCLHGIEIRRKFLNFSKNKGTYILVNIYFSLRKGIVALRLRCLMYIGMVISNVTKEYVAA